MGNSLSLDELVNLVWHWKVSDGMSWASCAGILRQDGIDIDKKQVKWQFEKFFEMLTGYTVYKACPKCSSGKIVPRKSQYGYFVGCSTYPSCKFIGKRIMKIEFD